MKDFIGNARVVAGLNHALASRRLPHALIFAGPDGIGKKRLAIELSKFLNCISNRLDNNIPNILDACETCSSCKKIANDSHPDVRIITSEETFIRIDQIRQLRNDAQLRPYEGRERIFVIDEAEKLNVEAANALLKTLEEPPEQVLLILITSNPHALLPTIRSRCQIYRFEPVGISSIETYLRSMGKLGDEEIAVAAKLSQGSISTASRFDMTEFRKNRKEIFLGMKNVIKTKDFVTACKLAQVVAKDKAQLETWLSFMYLLLRDMLVLKYSHEDHILINSDIVGTLDNLASEIETSSLYHYIETVKESRRAIEQNANRQLTLEVLFLNLMQA